MTALLPLKEQLKNLQHLQEIDLKIRQLDKQKQAYPSQLGQFSTSLAKLQKEYDQRLSEKNEIEKVHKQTLAAIELNDDRIQRTSKKLEAVGNTKEFQAATKEMDQLKKLGDELNVQKAKTGTDLEGVEKVFADITQKKEAVESEKSIKMATISTEEGTLDHSLKQLHSERLAFLSGVDKTILARYDRVRGAKEGLGIAPAVAGRCKGCNVMIAPQTLNKLVRGEEMESCPTCHRILYLPAAPSS